jgi:exonuclease SbcC
LKEIPKEYHDFAKLEESAEQAKIKYQQKEDEWQQQQEAYNDGGALAAAAAERAFSAERALKDALERAAKLAAEWDARLKAASLTQAEYDALLPHCRQSYIDKLYVKLENYDKEIKSLNDRLKRAAENAKNAEDIDLAALEGALKAAEANYNEELKLSGEMESANKKRGAHLADLQKLDAAMADFAARYGVIGHLAEIANGKNDFGVTFQRYVLGNLLDEVADAASERLKMMSRGRYLLQRTDERRRKNAQSGLELEIFDYYTGVARAVNTLSGGESFLASLSLSLGLADVVQNYAGGIKLDTIFIDEGFGTLDAESLDMALKTLIDLQSGGRLVGIISHVPELKERIDARLEVTGGRFGSTARFVLK